MLERIGRQKSRVFHFPPRAFRCRDKKWFVADVCMLVFRGLLPNKMSLQCFVNKQNPRLWRSVFCIFFDMQRVGSIEHFQINSNYNPSKLDVVLDCLHIIYQFNEAIKRIGNTFLQLLCFFFINKTLAIFPLVEKLYGIVFLYYTHQYCS